MMKRKTKGTTILLFVLFLIVVIATQLGFYSIHPIGAFPDGATWLIKRVSGEPFFNSPDAMSIRKTGNVSLLSRGIALAEAPINRIIIKLPYWKYAYLKSTGGMTF